MRELKFHYAKAKNLFCFGEEGIEFFFKDYGKIVLITGENYDDVDEEGRPGSNGSGKSSIQEILSIALFGKTIKNKLVSENIIHNKSTKKDKAYVEVIWDMYRVVRIIGTTNSGTSSSLRMWESKDHIWDEKSNVTKGTMAETQKYIEEKLGFNYSSFINIIVVDDRNEYAFLESDAKKKRQIAENTLALEQYAMYHSNAKEMIKEDKDSLKFLIKDYENIQLSITEAKNRLGQLLDSDSTWKTTKLQELNKISEEIKTKQKKLEESDVSQELKKYQEAQRLIEEISNTSIPGMEKNKETVVSLIKDIKLKLADLVLKREKVQNDYTESKNKLSSIINNIKSNQQLIVSIENLEEGKQCPTCYTPVNKNNAASILKKIQNSVKEEQEELAKEKPFFDENQKVLQELTNSINQMQNSIVNAEGKIELYNKKIDECHKKLTDLNKIQKPHLETEIRLLEESILQQKKTLQEKQEEFDRGSPYKEIIQDSKNNLNKKEGDAADLKQKCNDIEEHLKYLLYWEKAFGDDGIRKLVIDKILPSLNSRIAYWLQFLVDNRISLKLDSSLEPTIERNPADGNPFVYHAMSRGEKRRLNLSVSQSFGYITLLSNGCCPSLIFLDEISGGNVDQNGIPGIYNMLCELSKERQVFVTTHDAQLLSLLQGCDNITLRKKNGVTKMVS